MAETLSEGLVKARKPHTCMYCGGTIEVGTVYNHAVMKGDGIWSWDCHERCREIAAGIWDFVDPDEGMSSDDFTNEVEDFAHTFVCPNCPHYDRDACECRESRTAYQHPNCLLRVWWVLRRYNFQCKENDPRVWVLRKAKGIGYHCPLGGCPLGKNPDYCRRLRKGCEFTKCWRNDDWLQHLQRLAKEGVVWDDHREVRKPKTTNEKLKAVLSFDRLTADEMVASRDKEKKYTLHDCGVQRRALLDRIVAQLG